MIRRFHFAQCGRCAAGEKIADQLTGRRIVFTAEQIGATFQSFLQREPGQGAPGIIGCRIDPHDDARVGVALVARVLTHPVRDHAPGLRGRRDDRAARTHAKTVDRASVLRMVHEFVIGGTDVRMPGETPESRAIDHGLRMLDAKSDGERFCFHEDAATLEHPYRIAGTVSEREHDVSTLDTLAAVEHDTGNAFRSARILVEQ